MKGETRTLDLRMFMVVEKNKPPIPGMIAHRTTTAFFIANQKQRNTTADEGGEGPTEARQSNSESTSQTEMHAEGTHGIRGHRQVRSVDGFDPTRFCRY